MAVITIAIEGLDILKDVLLVCILLQKFILILEQVCFRIPSFI